jgi:ABC-type sugar transport system substrate-binding protein
MGRLAVESAYKLIRGENVPADQKVPIVLVTKTPQ